MGAPLKEAVAEAVQPPWVTGAAAAKLEVVVLEMVIVMDLLQ